MLIKDDGKYDESVIEELILKAIKEEDLKEVKDIVVYLKKTYGLQKRTVLNIIKRMKEKDKLALHKKTIRGVEGSAATKPRQQSIISYLQSPEATDLWVTLTLAVGAFIAALLIPEDLYPVVFLRWILGASFVLFIPGYAFTIAVFPQKELDLAERIAVSFGLSVAVVAFVSLLLNFSPWRITLTPVLICLALITGVSITVGAYRKAKTAKAIE